MAPTRRSSGGSPDRERTNRSTTRRSHLKRTGLAATLAAAAAGAGIAGTGLVGSRLLDGRTPLVGDGATARGRASRGPGTDVTSPAVGERLTGLRGAMYFPARAFNAYQTWANYDRDEATRDVRFAADLDLNALRLFVSYEHWLEDRGAFERRFDHLLETATAAGVGLLPVLFESIGDRPTRENRHDANVETSFAVHSPDRAVIRHPSRWGGPGAFVAWFASRYGGDDGVLAVEIMNEPGRWGRRVAFCRSMLRVARDAHPTVPLTMGCMALGRNGLYRDPPLDVLQFHHNFPADAATMRARLRRAERLAAASGRPVWLTEWQRTREVPPDVHRPNYSSLARTVRESGVDGDFFWSLMLKPAYMERPRKRGRLNGVFHEDGAVYSTGDAVAIAGSGDFADERRTWPTWTAGSAGG